MCVPIYGDVYCLYDITTCLLGSITEALYAMQHDNESCAIEQLRQRYRREAQLAIEEARTKAIAEVSQTLNYKVKLLEDEVRQWKAVAEALSSDDRGGETKQAPLIKYIMENVILTKPIYASSYSYFEYEGLQGYKTGV